MRAVLAFVPPASPSYAPLGLASLAAHLKTVACDCSLTLLDLNVEAWDWIAAEFMDDDAYAARRLGGSTAVLAGLDRGPRANPRPRH
jgi:hypothetical protein